MTDTALLQYFITESLERLEDMKTKLLQLESEPENSEILNDIFMSVHTLKRASACMRMEQIAELTEKFVDLLDMLRKDTIALTSDIFDTLMYARDRMVLLIGDLELTQSEKTSIDDILTAIEGYIENSDSSAVDMKAAEDGYTDEKTPAEQDDNIFNDEYYEGYDKELFDVFLEQVKESIFNLRQVAGEMLYSGNQAESLLEKYIDCIQSLYATANYMGYEKLADYYEKWTEELHSVLKAGHPGEGLDWQDYIETKIITRINKIIILFPQLQVGSAETDTAQEDIIANIPGTDEITAGVDEHNLDPEADAIAAGADAIDESVQGEEANEIGSNAIESVLDAEINRFVADEKNKHG